MHIFLAALLLVLSLGTANKVLAESIFMQDEAKKVAEMLSQKLPEKSRVIVADFIDLDGQITYFGRYFSEKVQIGLLNLNLPITLIERTQLDRAVAELELQFSGLMDQKTVLELGKMLGADIIVSGTVTDLQKTIDVSMKVLKIESGTSIDAVEFEIEKDERITQLVATIIKSEDLKQKRIKKEKKKYGPDFEWAIQDLVIDEGLLMFNLTAIITNWYDGGISYKNAKEKFLNKKSIVEYKKRKKDTQALIRKLKNPPPDYKETFKHLLEAYSLCCKLYDIYFNFLPSSFLFGQVKEIDDQFLKEIEKAKVLLPAIALLGKTALNVSASDPFTCGTSTVDDVEGNTYSTVLIGGQCWMGENMRTTKYPGGGSITKGPSAHGAAGWTADLSYYSCPPNADNSGEDCAAAGGVEKLGMLYQWSAAMNGSTTPGDQGICPSGWHVPTDADLKILVEGQGTAGCEASTGWQCSPAGDKLKKSGLAPDICAGATPPCGTSGFEGLLAGYRGTSGNYDYRGTYAHLWSSTPAGGNAWWRALFVSYTTVCRYTLNKAYGFSVRCLKD